MMLFFGAFSWCGHRLSFDDSAPSDQRSSALFLLQMIGELFCQLRLFLPVTYVDIRSVRHSLASANLLILFVETILLFDNKKKHNPIG
ncbi:hypothetical protein P4475_16705, partial [Halalkalibacterium halodurans]|uniref:hypothetical protein n=1 Tax=Halalkalibacterium halodurans TaxID=86665 RepID=UPI002E20CE26|nr:hypothetical protein [Halalkalibacterium halodurans]